MTSLDISQFIIYSEYPDLYFRLAGPCPTWISKKNTSWHKIAYNARPFLTKTKHFELNIFQTSSTRMKVFLLYIRCWIR